MQAVNSRDKVSYDLSPQFQADGAILLPLLEHALESAQRPPLGMHLSSCIHILNQTEISVTN